MFAPSLALLGLWNGRRACPELAEGAVLRQGRPCRRKAESRVDTPAGTTLYSAQPQRDDHMLAHGPGIACVGAAR